jgi:hypothetical protein
VKDMDFYTRENNTILYPVYPLWCDNHRTALLPAPHDIKFRFRDLSESRCSCNILNNNGYCVYKLIMTKGVQILDGISGSKNYYAFLIKIFIYF